MLVLSRKSTELVHIGDQVRIRVVRVAGNRVWIGIDAPQEVRIVRHEISGAGNSDANCVRPPAEPSRPDQ
jgi:carbon storage regulator